MTQLNFHNNQLLSPPQQRTLPVVQRLINAYKLWQEYIVHFPKKSRYALGQKIDILLVEIGSLAFSAGMSKPPEKLLLLQQAIKKFDLLKFLLRVAWEIKALDNKKYITLSTMLYEIGRMLGGWLRKVSKETPTR